MGSLCDPRLSACEALGSDLGSSWLLSTRNFCPASRRCLEQKQAVSLTFPSLESSVCPRLSLLKPPNLYSVSKWGSLLGAPGPCQALHLYLINPSSEIQSVINSSLAINVPRGLQGRASIVNEKQNSCPNYWNENNGDPLDVLQEGQILKPKQWPREPQGAPPAQGPCCALSTSSAWPPCPY